MTIQKTVNRVTFAISILILSASLIMSIKAAQEGKIQRAALYSALALPQAFIWYKIVKNDQ